MTIKGFIKKIEELKQEIVAKKIQISSCWSINVLDDDFNAYHSPIYHMVFCLDKIQLFPIISLYDTFTADDDYYFFGEDPESGWIFALDQENKELLFLDNYDKTITEYCAKDDYHFLDALLVAATYYKEKIITFNEVEKSIEDWLEKCSTAAGGEKYLSFCKRLLG